VDDVIHAGDDLPGERRVGAVALEKLDTLADVLPVSGDEIVGDAHAMAAFDERF